MEKLNRSEVFFLLVFAGGLLFGVAIGLVMAQAIVCPIPAAPFDPTPIFQKHQVQSALILSIISVFGILVHKLVF